jgi:cell division septum initiation protein DivIVA
MPVSDIQKETFRKLLGQIREHVEQLNRKNRELKRENMKLKTKLNEVHKEQSDIFSNISESERLAMRHQVTNLIDKINSHLDS